jgi:hypothetical protein
MSIAVTTLTMAALALIGYGIWLAWPPLAFVVVGIALLRVTWSLDAGGES